mmetsp:Transcript_25508/g.64811  ORF Transcript_25508/g.64811 Transcript_25508/m.64811 type:complete len:244 (+) Transcript_25508:196-927(+)
MRPSLHLPLLRRDSLDAFHLGAGRQLLENKDDVGYEAVLHADLTVEVCDLLHHQAAQGLPLVRVVLHRADRDLGTVGHHRVGLLVLLRPEALGHRNVAHRLGQQPRKLDLLDVAHVVGRAAAVLDERRHARVFEPLVDAHHPTDVAHRRRGSVDQLPVPHDRVVLERARDRVDHLELADDLQHLCAVLLRRVEARAKRCDHLEQLGLELRARALGVRVCSGRHRRLLRTLGRRPAAHRNARDP